VMAALVWVAAILELATAMAIQPAIGGVS
jgi:hypothetical protein